MFLNNQKPRGSAYIIGDAGLINALYNVGYTMNNVDPDYVVIGETRSYSYETIEKAINLVLERSEAHWCQSRCYRSRRTWYCAGNKSTCIAD